MPDKKIEKSVGVYDLPVEDRKNLFESYFDNRLAPTLIENVFTRLAEKSEQRFATYGLEEEAWNKFCESSMRSLKKDINWVHNLTNDDEKLSKLREETGDDSVNFFDISAALEYKIRGGELTDEQKKIFAVLNKSIKGASEGEGGWTSTDNEVGVNAFSSLSIEEIFAHEQTHFLLNTVGGEYIKQVIEDRDILVNMGTADYDLLINNLKYYLDVGKKCEYLLLHERTMQEMFAFSSVMFYGDDLESDNYKDFGFGGYKNITVYDELVTFLRDLAPTFRNTVALEDFDSVCAKTFKHFIENVKNIDYKDKKINGYKKQIKNIYDESTQLFVDGLEKSEKK